MEPTAATKLSPGIRDLSAPNSLALPTKPEMVRIQQLRPLSLAEILNLAEVNNPNLKTFQVDLATTERLAEEVPDEVLLVSESGLKSPADAQRVLDAGANAVLIGEALMRAHDPSREIEAYLALEAS